MEWICLSADACRLHWIYLLDITDLDIEWLAQPCDLHIWWSYCHRMWRTCSTSTFCSWSSHRASPSSQQLWSAGFFCGRPCDMELVTRQSERSGHQQRLLQAFTEDVFIFSLLVYIAHLSFLGDVLCKFAHLLTYLVNEDKSSDTVCGRMLSQDVNEH